MALGAMEHIPGLKVRIVPVGLSYFHPHRFRSRAVVEFGPALTIPEELVDQFRLGGDEKRKSAGKLLDMIYDALKTVTIRAPDYETLMVIQAARRLYKTPGQHLTLGQVVDLNKRFIEGYMHFQHEPKVQQLRKNVLKYNRRVRDLGLRDHQVSSIPRRLEAFIADSPCTLIGPEGKACRVENSRTTSLPNNTPLCMDYLGPSWHGAEWSYIPSCIHNFPQEG